MKRTKHLTGQETFELFRALHRLIEGEPVDVPEQKAALDAFMSMVGKSHGSDGITIEPDADYAGRETIGVRATREGRQIVIVVEERKAPGSPSQV